MLFCEFLHGNPYSLPLLCFLLSVFSGRWTKNTLLDSIFKAVDVCVCVCAADVILREKVKHIGWPTTCLHLRPVLGCRSEPTWRERGVVAKRGRSHSWTSQSTSRPPCSRRTEYWQSRSKACRKRSWSYFGSPVNDLEQSRPGVCKRFCYVGQNCQLKTQAKQM